MNINNVDPSTSSPYASYAPGKIVFTITVLNHNYADSAQLSTCFDYDIAIDANNNITTKAIDLNK